MKKLLTILLIIIYLPLAFLILGVLSNILFGGGAMFGLTITDNIMAVVMNGLGAGSVGLYVLCILFSLLIIKWRRKY